MLECIQLCPQMHDFHVRKGGNLQINIGGRPCGITEGAEGKGSIPHYTKGNMKCACQYLGCFWCEAVCEGDILSFYLLKELGLPVGLSTTVIPLTSAEVLFYTLNWPYTNENLSA